MSMQDPVADMLTRIRNAQTAGELQVQLSASKLKAAILTVLQQEGYITGFDRAENNGKAIFTVILKYYQDRPVIEKIKRISKPGLRIYKRSDDLPIIKAGMGIAIISTSKGVMTGQSARSQKLGGEVMCVVE